MYIFLIIISGSKNILERIIFMFIIIEFLVKLECISCIKCSILKFIFGNNCNGSFILVDLSILFFKNFIVKIDL